MFGFGNVRLFRKCKASRERLDYVRNRLSKSHGYDEIDEKHALHML